MKRKLLLFMMSFVLAGGMMTVPGNTCSTVCAAEITPADVEIAVPTEISDIFSIGTISSDATEDNKAWYEFTPDHDGLIDIEDLAKYARWELFKKENNSWTSMGGLHNNDLIKGNTYRLAAWRLYTDPDTFQLGITAVDDVSPSAVGAAKVELNEAVSEKARSINDIDWYKFNTGKNTVVGVFKAGLHEMAHIDLYSDDSESEKSLIIKGDDDGFGWTKVKANTTYYIKVKDEFYRYVGNSPFDYTFTIQGKTDAGDTEKTASKLKVGKLYKELCYSDKDTDFFTFKAKKTGTVKIEGAITNAPYYVKYFYLSVNQKNSASMLINKQSLNDNFEHSFAVKKGKTYYVKFTTGNPTCEYQFKCKYGK